MLATPLLALLLAAPPAPDEAFISLREKIGRLDLETGDFTILSSGLKVPFYGVVGEPEGPSGERYLYMPDTFFRALWKIGMDGSKQLLAFQGLLQAPTHATFHPTSGELYLSDGLAQAIFKVDPQTGAVSVFADNSAGHFDYPGGMDFAADGTLYVSDAVNAGLYTVDAAGTVSPFFDGAVHGYTQMGGVQVDGCGNVFVATFNHDHVLRIRRDGSSWEVFAEDPVLMNNPNDIKLSRDGGLLVSASESSSLCRLDPQGVPSLVAQDASFGGWFGVAVPGDHPRCNGQMESFGSGTAGAGGFVPAMTGIYTPCPGNPVGYVIQRGEGGAFGFAIYGSEGATSAFGGTIHIDFSGFWGLRPVQLDGVGPGAGEYRWTAAFAANPNLVGYSFVLQALIRDSVHPSGWAMSEGLRTTFGQ